MDGFLVTEAVRGEGARLLNARGERFVDELAPRDEVARAIHAQLGAAAPTACCLDMREHRPDARSRTSSRRSRGPGSTRAAI